MRSPRWLPVAALCLSSCLEVRYAAQATQGQLDLWSRIVDLDDVASSKNTDAHTRDALNEVKHILAFGERQGLDSQGNYQSYVDLPRDQVVWFMAACPPLTFEPVTWSFPFVGSFPYLGWFQTTEALTIQKRLQKRGLDVFLRPVRAYSTGGWFRDPVLSTMISLREDVTRSLANVLLHELTHANILVNDQSTYNESLASFVGDGMAEDYLAKRFGKHSHEVEVYRQELALYRKQEQRLGEVYRQLDTLYQSNAAEADKLREKKKILAALEVELDLEDTPNNALLVNFKTYNAGFDEFEKLYEHCGKSWPRFLAAAKEIKGDWFPEEQTDNIGPAIARRLKTPCQSARKTSSGR
jgi:predicted aminopeptidase